MFFTIRERGEWKTGSPRETRQPPTYFQNCKVFLLKSSILRKSFSIKKKKTVGKPPFYYFHGGGGMHATERGSSITPLIFKENQQISSETVREKRFPLADLSNFLGCPRNHGEKMPQISQESTT